MEHATMNMQANIAYPASVYDYFPSRNDTANIHLDRTSHLKNVFLPIFQDPEYWYPATPASVGTTPAFLNDLPRKRSFPEDKDGVPQKASKRRRLDIEPIALVNTFQELENPVWGLDSTTDNLFSDNDNESEASSNSDKDEEDDCIDDESCGSAFEERSDDNNDDDDNDDAYDGPLSREGDHDDEDIGSVFEEHYDDDENDPLFNDVEDTAEAETESDTALEREHHEEVAPPKQSRLVLPVKRFFNTALLSSLPRHGIVMPVKQALPISPIASSIEHSAASPSSTQPASEKPIVHGRQDSAIDLTVESEPAQEENAELQASIEEAFDNFDETEEENAELKASIEDAFDNYDENTNPTGEHRTGPCCKNSTDVEASTQVKGKKKKRTYAPPPVIPDTYKARVPQDISSSRSSWKFICKGGRTYDVPLRLLVKIPVFDKVISSSNSQRSLDLGHHGITFLEDGNNVVLPDTIDPDYFGKFVTFLRTKKYDILDLIDESMGPGHNFRFCAHKRIFDLAKILGYQTFVGVIYSQIHMERNVLLRDNAEIHPDVGQMWQEVKIKTPSRFRIYKWDQVENVATSLEQQARGNRDV